MSTDLLSLLDALGRGLVRDLWVPCLLWGIAAAVVLALDAALPLRRPRLRTRLLGATLGGLPVALVLVQLARHLPTPRVALDPVAVLEAGWTVEVVAGAGAAEGPVWDAWAVASALMGGFALVAALIGLVRHTVATRRLHGHMNASAPAGRALQTHADGLAHAMGAPASRVRHYGGPVPAAVWWRGEAVVCLPHSFDGSDLDLALRHELAHVAHGDVRFVRAEALVRALMLWHPLVAMLARRIDLRREQACDAAVLAHVPTMRRPYADLLVRLASERSDDMRLGGALPVASMAVRPSTLRRRMEALLLPLGTHLGRTGRVGVAASALALVAATAMPGWTESMHDNGTAVLSSAHSLRLTNARDVEMTAAAALPRYVVLAGIAGAADVHVTVSADGRVSDATVLRVDNDAMRRAAEIGARVARFALPVPAGSTTTLRIRLDPALSPRGTPDDPLPVYDRLEPLAGAPEDFVEVDTQPMSRTRLDPLYPSAASRDSIEARVTARAWVGADGVVRAVQVLRVSTYRGGLDLTEGAGRGPMADAFAESARQAMQGWTFEPARRDGEAVPVWVTIPMRFRLTSGTTAIPFAVGSAVAATMSLTPTNCGMGTVSIQPGETDVLPRIDGRTATTSDLAFLTCALQSALTDRDRLRRLSEGRAADQAFALRSLVHAEALVASLEAAVRRLQ